MRLISRKSKIPTAYTAFPWVRKIRVPFVDCEEDTDVVIRYKRIHAGALDVGVLDNQYSLTLAVNIPDDIEQANGTSNRLYVTDRYYWDYPDVIYLLQNGSPASVDIAEAGFDTDRLIELASPDRCLAYIRALEEFSCKPKGHYLPIHLENKLAQFERQHRGGAFLRASLRGLRVDLDPILPSSTIPETTRNAVLQYNRYQCIFDGRGRPDHHLHVHHIIPKKLIERLGLSIRLYSARENLVACCAGCNIVKSDKLTPADINFYFSQFSDSHHPNHGILAYLVKIRDLQQFN